MKKINRIALFLFALGIVFIIISLVIIKFDFSNLSRGGEYIIKSEKINQDISKIYINGKTSNLNIIKSETENFELTYDENDKEKYKVLTENNELSIKSYTTYKWFEYFFNISYKKRKFNLAVPESFNGNIEIYCDNGSINITGINAFDVKLGSDNGLIYLKDFNSSSIQAKTDNGEIYAYGVKTSENIDFQTKNGFISLNQCEAREIKLNTDHGNMKMEEVTLENSIVAKTDNGNIKISKLSFITYCNLNTKNGDITGSIVGEIEDFSFDCSSSNGNCNVPKDYEKGSKKLTVKTSNGNIKIDFME